MGNIPQGSAFRVGQDDGIFGVDLQRGIEPGTRVGVAAALPVRTLQRPAQGERK